MWFSDSSENLVFLVAVHFISELTKLELIITIFEHSYVYLTPSLRISVFILHAALDIGPLYSTTCYVCSKGGIGPWSQIYHFHNLPHISPIFEKGCTTVSKHGDVIEMHKLKVCLPKIF